MAKNVSLINVIDNQVKESHRENKKDRDETRFHPSTVGFCTRKIVYMMLEFPAKEPEPRVMRIFENGHSMHERFENWFEDAGVQIAAELELSPDSEDPAIAERCRELGISGKTDSLIELQGEKYLVELKSANDKMFYNYLKEPKKEHVDQLQLYMYLSGVHQGFVLYECKNDQNLKEFFIYYDQAKASQLIDKIITINDHVENKTLPPREFNKSHWQCKYCDFSIVCWYPNSEEASRMLAEKNTGEELTEKYNIITKS